MKPTPTIVLVILVSVLIALLFGIVAATAGKGYNLVALGACVVLGFPIIWMTDDIFKRFK